MRRNTEFYFRLGVGPDATFDEISIAYSRKTEELKPELKPESESAKTRFQLVCEAYEVLSDEEKRKIYDRYGKKGLQTGCEDGDEKDGDSDRKDKVEKEKDKESEEESFELDEEHLTLFAQYVEAKETPPPDHSFSDRDNLQDYQVFKVLNTIPTKGSMSWFKYKPFQINPWNVSKLVQQWVESWYRVPRDFANCAVIPHRFARVFVPFYIISTEICLWIHGTETYTPPEEKPCQVNYNPPSHSVTPKTTKVTPHANAFDRFFVCSAQSSQDCQLYEQWVQLFTFWSYNTFNPDTEFGLLPPLDQCDAVELEHMHDLAYAEHEKQKMGFFQSLWSTVKGVFGRENKECQGLPSDAYMLPTSSFEEVWKDKGDRIMKQMTDLCLDNWKKGAFTNYQRSVQWYTIDSFRKYYSLVYMPVYSGTYTYGGKQYRIAVNGMNGKIIGDVPQGTFGSFFSNLFSHMGFGSGKRE